MKNQVRALRTRHDLAQGQLAEAMGVSRQTINSIENERYMPSLPLAIAVAGLVLIVTLIVAWLTEIAQGHSEARTLGCAPSAASATRSQSHSSAGVADRPRRLLKDCASSRQAGQSEEHSKAGRKVGPAWMRGSIRW